MMRNRQITFLRLLFVLLTLCAAQPCKASRRTLVNLFFGEMYPVAQNFKRFPYGPSKFCQNSLIVNHGLYWLSANPKTRLPDWVVYEVNPENFSTDDQRPNRKIRNDDVLPEGYALSRKDYHGVGAMDPEHDRGHTAPISSFAGHPEYRKVNYVSSLLPQRSSLNRGPWQVLESEIAALSARLGAVCVATGPYYDEDRKESLTLPNAPHCTIPDGFWKLSALRLQGKWLVWAHAMDQDAEDSKDINKYQLPITDLEEKLGGIKLFPFVDYTDMEGVCARKH